MGQKQFLRPDEVRPPVAPDTLSQAQIISCHFGGATDIQNYIAAVVSQIRGITGMNRWCSTPPTNLRSLQQQINQASQQASNTSGQINLVLPCSPQVMAGQLVYLGPDGVLVPADCTQYQMVLGMAVGVPGDGTAAVQRVGQVASPLAPITPGVPHFLAGGSLPVPGPLDDSVTYVQQVGIGLTPTSLLMGCCPIAVKRYIGP